MSLVQIGNFAFSLLSTFIFFRFTDRMLCKKYPALLVYIVMILWYQAESYVNINLGLYKVFPQSLFFVLNGLAINFVLFKGSKGKKLLTALFLHAGIGTLSSFVFIPFISFLSTRMEDADRIKELYGLCEVLIFLFSALLLEFLGKRFKNIRGNLPFDCCMYLFILTIFISQAVVFICDSQQVNNRDQWTGMIFSTFCAIIGIGLIVFSIHYVDKRVSLSLEEQQNALLTAHITSLMNQEEATASLRHDMKNHLLCLGNLLETGHFQEAQAYLAGVTKMGRQTETVVSTGNVYVDAVLQEKKALADTCRISMEIDILLPSELIAAPLDLSIILSNALDNALEACKELSDDCPGKIYLSSYIKQNFLVLDISNTIFKPVQIIDNTIESTKPDKNLHGIGLYNIKAAVLRCGGNMKLSVTENYFTLSIVLPMLVH